uniref:EOG090X0BHG n=1 Tax=Evadne anonyx TaxID=141404 RepID=A0A9N6ZFI5_9CRUS|nr:EOG090X0BHG [Evadne anonyx]
MFIKFSFSIFLFFCFIESSHSWDQSELEIFDLAEEVGQNFYDVLEVSQNCSQSDIRRAYRKLSLQLHPDKNDASDAEVRFRQLVGIYEILRDGSKRSRYDQVLVDGLPDWRQPLYYYRRVRKMGMFELSIWLFIFITIGQYAVAWASYFEKKLAVEELVSSKLKKMQKKIKKKKAHEIDMQEQIEQFLTKPSYKNTLPFQLFNCIIALPYLYGWIQNFLEERKREKEEEKEREREEAEELEREREEMEQERERKKYRKKRAAPPPEIRDDPVECILDAVDEPLSQQEATVKPKRLNTGMWTDDDLNDLAKFMKKYPTGTTERWEKIAEALNRSIGEVTHFAKKVKNQGFKPPSENESQEEHMSEEEKAEKKKEKTRGGKNLKSIAEPENEEKGEVQIPGSTGWSQKQQKSLETALSIYTKGSSERWERIAKAVPDKTKEECMLRVKYLSDLVKKKKQSEEEMKSNEQITEEPSKIEDRR